MVGPSRSDSKRKPSKPADDDGVDAPATAPRRVRAHLFVVGRSQAVRLPKAFRFSGAEVFIRRTGQSVVLEPVVPSQWPAGYWDSVDATQDLLFGGGDRSPEDPVAPEGRARRRQ